jgi:hypothetical protein
MLMWNSVSRYGGVFTYANDPSLHCEYHDNGDRSGLYTYHWGKRVALYANNNWYECIGKRPRDSDAAGE